MIAMTLEEMKHEIVQQISTFTDILSRVPFYKYPEEKIFALEEIQHYVKHIKTVDDLKTYCKRLLQTSKEFGDRAKESKTKSEKDNCLGLEAGYKMGYTIIKTELENENLKGKHVSTPKKKATRKITARKTKN